MTTSSNSSNPSQAQTSGMWGGRFSEATDALLLNLQHLFNLTNVFINKTLQARLHMQPCWQKLAY